MTAGAQAAALMKIAIQGADVDEVIRQADRLLQELRAPGLCVVFSVTRARARAPS